MNRRRWSALAVVAALLAVCALLLLRRGPAAGPEAKGEAGAAAAVAGARAARQPGAGPASPTALPPNGAAAPPSAPGGAATAPRLQEFAAGHPLDLARLKRALPGNLYFELDEPTTDPDVLREREADARHWEELYGKVLSGTGTEAEVRDYFEHRRRVSTDYRDFALKALELSGDELPERDRGLLELSARMHTDRLAEVDQKLAEALARKAQQDKLRAEWERAGKPMPPPPQSP
jgi:hypothetical protein